MQNIKYRLIELFVVFILIPICFTMRLNVWLKLAIGLIGFIYVVYVLLKIENNKFKIRQHINWTQFWQRTFMKFVVVAILTMTYVYWLNKESLFIVISEKPTLWIFILFVYSVFSVYPQELVYRTFFFQRYESLFRSHALFIAVNAVLFSLAHLFFKNSLVLLLTFLGGILFALTFKKTKSTLLVSIEHAIYGSWLFTVGMGEMLGFPN